MKEGIFFVMDSTSIQLKLVSEMNLWRVCIIMGINAIINENGAIKASFDAIIKNNDAIN
ncbi:hypothetical protein [Rossellomorea aquimaris]|uniref:hypothetical protein n=1 Tax=Rossellomorea aquimaris TaxID=189382 RepID=UPI000AECCB9D|nr:hypothetical protein [Rossellomorea aquimaris]